VEAVSASDTPSVRQFRVTQELNGKHPIHTDYPLLPGDLLVMGRSVHEWTKVAPGLGVFGFKLTAEDIQTLEPADDARWVIE
jgi:hypothetical protein